MRPWVRPAIGALAVLAVLLVGFCVYWSREPDLFTIDAQPDNERYVTGYATISTLIRIAETLLDKPGGYLSNDIMPPGVLLDNIPNWEFGVLQQVRDLARVARNDYSRSQSQSKEDTDLAVAEPKFFFDNDSWILPPSESEYREAIAGFIQYRDRLAGVREPEALFYARADNLREWLAQVEKRLGSMSRRLGDSVVARGPDSGTAGSVSGRSVDSAGDSFERTSWFEIDDVFFEARGTAWALVHLFRAAEIDFNDVLSDKNAEASLHQIIRELEAALAPLRSPVILNGGGFGLFANHSLVMANYLARANAAVINLRELLDQG
jgi:hypothetical protein